MLIKNIIFEDILKILHFNSNFGIKSFHNQINCRKLFLYFLSYCTDFCSFFFKVFWNLIRDRLLIPQVLFFVVQEKGGEGVEATENGKLVEKPEENGVGGGLQT